MCAYVPQHTYLFIRKSHAFGIRKDRDVSVMFRKLLFRIGDVTEFTDEKSVYAGYTGDLRSVDTTPQKFRYSIYPVIRSDLYIVFEFIRIRIVKLGKMHMESPDLKASYRFKKALFDRPSDAHYLSGCLHLGSEAVVGIGELIKRESRHFRYDIVHRRFKRCYRVRKFYLLKMHTYRYLG